MSGSKVPATRSPRRSRSEDFGAGKEANAEPTDELRDTKTTGDLTARGPQQSKSNGIVLPGMPTARRGIAGGAYVRPNSAFSWEVRAKNARGVILVPEGWRAIIVALPQAADANTMADQRPDGRKRAHRRPQRPAHPRRPRYADGGPPAPLLAADRRRQRTREKSDQADPADGREPCALQGYERHFRSR